MDDLFSLYHRDIPPFLQQLSQLPPMQRLRQVGMNCGCEYTRFPLFCRCLPYSRYDHSIGTALIVWHFTQSLPQTVAAALHDIATPAFAHAVDFLRGDHLRQESTEADTRQWICRSAELMAFLEAWHLDVEAVWDYHRYSLADNPLPRLSADRLEYTLGNLFSYGFAPRERLAAYYENLIVGQGEDGAPELAFSTSEIAAAFTRDSLKTARIYVCDPDRFAMQTLANLLDRAMARGVLKPEDLSRSEPEVIALLRCDPAAEEEWERFCRLSRIHRASSPGPEPGWVRVAAKKRYINPLVAGRGRIDALMPDIRRAQEQFLSLGFSSWLWGE